MDQNATSDYYIVASARFVNESLWQRVTGVAVLHYSNSKGPVSGPLPEAPNDIYYPWAAMNQPRSIKLVLGTFENLISLFLLIQNSDMSLFAVLGMLVYSYDTIASE